MNIIFKVLIKLIWSKEEVAKFFINSRQNLFHNTILVASIREEAYIKNNDFVKGLNCVRVAVYRLKRTVYENILRKL